VGALVGRQCLPTSDPGPSFPLADEVIAHDRGIVLNDASQLSPTPVASHITVRDNSPKAAVERVRAALTEARIAGHPFIASAARHSMGGQSLARDGAVVTLDQQWLEPDTAAKVYRVAAGARWSTVIAKLDAIGFSPTVMQSNNDFGVPRRQAPVSSVVPRGTSSARKSNLIGPSDSAGGPRLGWGRFFPQTRRAIPS